MKTVEDLWEKSKVSWCFKEREMQKDSIKEGNMVGFEADDMIYNRFDLIYKDNVERFLYEFGDEAFAVDAHYEKSRAVLNVWGKKFPQEVFERAIESIFSQHSEIHYIDIKRAGNDYRNLLNECNDIRVPIPKSEEELLLRLRAKHRYTLKRIKRLLEQEYGKLETILYSADIPSELVDQYFNWKQITHGTDYHMMAEEYLQKYYVTDGILLRAGGRNIAILFFCQVNNTVYLENLSYDTEMEKFSPGYIIYEMFLEELIKRRCSYLYLGGGKYEYKRRFGAEESVAYSGIIYRKEVFNALNIYFERNGVKKIAIYGLGAVGHTFLKIVNLLNVDLVYGIDREEKRIEGLAVYSPEGDLEKVDAVIITLKFHNKEVEELLKLKFEKIYYWHDIATGNLMKEE